jgi:hypothetical protein
MSSPYLVIDRGVHILKRHGFPLVVQNTENILNLCRRKQRCILQDNAMRGFLYDQARSRLPIPLFSHGRMTWPGNIIPKACVKCRTIGKRSLLDSPFAVR